ncbi:Plasma membrane fusion protein PRM1 [Smittium culicis]|uniref:Plasma membrane fusion protein PRM1 n=1 Tax=Smittium culicis TaxID=133412 RepID=A0A1R1XAA9_9FUNG|nr:Plasma membrane fusion protein PRM1 [Smittium culicis]
MALKSKENVSAACDNLSQIISFILNVPGNSITDSLQSIDKIANNSLSTISSLIDKSADISGLIVELVVKLYIGTTICLLRVLAESSLDILSGTAKSFETAAQSAINSLLSSVTDGVQSISGGLASAANGIDSLLGKLNINTSISNVTSSLNSTIVNSLSKNVTIELPTEWINKIDLFKNSIPTEDELYPKLANFTSYPASLLSNSLSTFISNHKLSLSEDFNYNPLNLNICPKNFENLLIDPIHSAIKSILMVGLVSLILLILFSIIINAFFIKKNFLFELKSISKFQSEIETYTSTHNPLNQNFQPLSHFNNDDQMIPQKFQNEFNKNPFAPQSYNSPTFSSLECHESGYHERSPKIFTAKSINSNDKYYTKNYLPEDDIFYTPTKNSLLKTSFSSKLHSSKNNGDISLQSENLIFKFHEKYPTQKHSKSTDLDRFSIELLDMYYCTKTKFLRIVKNNVNSFTSSRKSANSIRWLAHFIYEKTLITMFIIGFFGLVVFSVQKRYIASVQYKLAPEIALKLENIKTSIKTDHIITINTHLSDYVNTTNSQIISTSQTLNSGLLEFSSSAKFINTTLDNFVSNYTNLISTAFNNTILLTPILGYVNCTVTKKIQNVQSIITLIDPTLNNLNFTLPNLPNLNINFNSSKLSNPITSGFDHFSKLIIGSQIISYELNTVNNKHKQFPSPLFFNSENVLIPSNSSNYKMVISDAKRFGGYSGGLLKLISDPILNFTNKQITISWFLMIPWSTVIVLGCIQTLINHF